MQIDPLTITLHTPTPQDSAALHKLVFLCPPLSPNSAYCNLLQCGHFAGTSVAAKCKDELVGFVSGYRIPDRPDTLFVWQVAVAADARGHGLGRRMLEHLLVRLQPAGVRFIEASITPPNQASWSLFNSLARRAGVAVECSVLFGSGQHFEHSHECEELVRIGPFKNPVAAHAVTAIAEVTP